MAGLEAQAQELIDDNLEKKSVPTDQSRHRLRVEGKLSLRVLLTVLCEVQVADLMQAEEAVECLGHQLVGLAQHLRSQQSLESFLVEQFCSPDQFLEIEFTFEFQGARAQRLGKLFNL